MTDLLLCAQRRTIFSLENDKSGYLTQSFSHNRIEKIEADVCSTSLGNVNQ